MNTSKSYKLYLMYDELFTEDDDGGDPNEPWSDRPTSHCTFTPTGLYSENSPIWNETLDVDFDPKSIGDQEVFIVIVTYSSGDTFGHSTGNWHIERATLSREEAVRLCQSIKDNSYVGYKPWEGYFETLEDVEIWKSRVIQSSGPGCTIRSF